MKEAEYIAILVQAFQDLHNCKATHIASEPVQERFQGKTVWDGEVEVFTLQGHPKAQKGYAWASDPKNKSTIASVLEIPPVDSAQTAVRAAIVFEKKKGATRANM